MTLKLRIHIWLLSFKLFFLRATCKHHAKYLHCRPPYALVCTRCQRWFPLRIR